jgi:hypothetical protein
MKTTVYNTWKQWGVICFTPMVAIDFDDKVIRIAWIILQIEINKNK